ncbi:MAG TPA: DUF5011 domain-containing protein [Bacteroidales bacterium]|nr:DUF5011 domain-containing protein [Bacteroidales bacterium]
MIRSQQITKLVTAGVLALLVALFSCQQVDETPPILILKGEDTVKQILNVAYIDGGASATDETDGNITNNIFVENTVNVDRVGFYTITYKVLDNGGNEAVPIHRVVEVYNQARKWNSIYEAAEEETSGAGGTCGYSSLIYADSAVNYRIVFSGFACNPDISGYANISDTLLVLPYQEYEDSLTFLSMTGSGWIKDSLITLDYQRKTNGVITYWNATFNR